MLNDRIDTHYSYPFDFNRVNESLNCDIGVISVRYGNK